MEGLQEIRRQLKQRRPRALKNRLPILVLSILVVGVVAYLVLQPSTQETGRLEVKVIDSSTGNGLKGITVTVDGQVETTDSEGRASFTLPKGKHTIILQKKGYGTKQFTASAPGSYTIDLVKSEEGPSKGIEVKVIDSGTGKGLDGTTVLVDNNEEITGPDGKVTFDIPDGNYIIILQKEGYETKQFTAWAPGSYTIDLIQKG